MKKFDHIITHAKYPSEKLRAATAAVYVGGFVTTFYDKLLLPYGISLTKIRLLRTLFEKHPVPASFQELSDNMLETSSDVSRIINRLQKDGFVKKISGKEDRRRAKISLTSKGADIFSSIRRDSYIAFKPLEKLSEKDAAQLTSLLRKMYESLLG